MTLQTPQNQSPNPKPYQNPQEFPSENAKESYNPQIRAANMEKFKEVVMKLANSVPNRPLAEIQNSLIHDQLNRFLSVLHTPDHPPYAWMIERALRELNERGGSSEESISNFIRKEYDDLPWCHFTLLKHHLEVLCKCGDIILTHGQHYLLAGADPTLKSGKRCRRKPTRRKRDWDWEINSRKRRKKDIFKESPLQKEDRLREEQNFVIEGLEQQNLEAEVRKGRTQLCIVREDEERIEDDQIEILTPGGPPGFESATLGESSHLPVRCTENPSQGTHPVERPPDVTISAAEGLSGHQEQIHIFNVFDKLNREEEQMTLSTHGTPETSADQTLEEVQPMTTNGVGMRQNKYEEHRAMPIQARPPELCCEKKLPESELMKNTAAISETEPVNSAGGKRVTQIVFKYRKRPPAVLAAKEKDLSHTIQEIKEKMLQQKQRKCQGQKHLGDNPRVSSLLQHQLQEHELSNTNELQGVKSEAANRSEHQGLPIPAATCEEHHESAAIIVVPEGPAVSSELSICSKLPNGGDAHEFSALPMPSEIEAMDTEESLQTARMQRQTKRWFKQLSNLKRPQLEHQAPVKSSRVTRKQEKLHTEEKSNAGQLKVSLASSVTLKQANSPEFSKLARLQMHPELEPQIETSNDKPEEQVSQEKTSCRVLRPRPLKLEQSNALTTAEISLSHHQHDAQQQPKYSRRGRPPKARPDSGVMNDKVVSFPNPHSRQQSQKPKHEHRGRPPKWKPGASTIINKKLLSGTQQHKPTHGRGRPRKAVEGE